MIHGDLEEAVPWPGGFGPCCSPTVCQMSFFEAGGLSFISLNRCFGWRLQRHCWFSQLSPLFTAQSDSLKLHYSFQTRYAGFELLSNSLFFHHSSHNNFYHFIWVETIAKLWRLSRSDYLKYFPYPYLYNSLHLSLIYDRRLSLSLSFVAIQNRYTFAFRMCRKWLILSIPLPLGTILLVADLDKDEKWPIVENTTSISLAKVNI